jgi:hypothetical protein
MTLTLTLLTFLVSLAVVYAQPLQNSQQTTFQPTNWDLDGFKSLVTFGDSYTDESRAWYFNDHGGHAPPAGWVGGVVSQDLFLNDSCPLIIKTTTFLLNVITI